MSDYGWAFLFFCCVSCTNKGLLYAYAPEWEPQMGRSLSSHAHRLFFVCCCWWCDIGNCTGIWEPWMKAVQLKPCRFLSQWMSLGWPVSRHSWYVTSLFYWSFLFLLFAAQTWVHKAMYHILYLKMFLPRLKKSYIFVAQTVWIVGENNISGYSPLFSSKFKNLLRKNTNFPS